MWSAAQYSPVPNKSMLFPLHSNERPIMGIISITYLFEGHGGGGCFKATFAALFSLRLCQESYIKPNHLSKAKSAQPSRIFRVIHIACCIKAGAAPGSSILQWGNHGPFVNSAFKILTIVILVQIKNISNPAFQDQERMQADVDAASVYSPQCL